MSNTGPVPWLDDDLRERVEVAVSAHLGRAWHAERFRDLRDLASHPCAVLADASFGAFVKLGTEPDAAQRFEVEIAGLAYLADHAGVDVPTPIGTVTGGAGTLMIMRALEAVARGPREWRQIGHTLARIHRVKSDRCGFPMDNYFGPLPQINTPLHDWPTFYGECRLRPRLKMAVDAGRIPGPLAAQVESVIRRLPELCGHAVTPTLLHGDAQRNNFVTTNETVYVVDPAIAYGHPELDLAYLGYWQPVPVDVLEAYREEMPVDPGYEKRIGLWRASGYLAAVAVEGAPYVAMLADALRTY